MGQGAYLSFTSSCLSLVSGRFPWCLFEWGWFRMWQCSLLVSINIAFSSFISDLIWEVLVLSSSLSARLLLRNVLGWAGGRRRCSDWGGWFYVSINRCFCFSSVDPKRSEEGERGECREEVLGDPWGGCQHADTEWLWCCVSGSTILCLADRGHRMSQNWSNSTWNPGLFGWKPPALKRCLRFQHRCVQW